MPRRCALWVIVFAVLTGRSALAGEPLRMSADGFLDFGDKSVALPREAAVLPSPFAAGSAGKLRSAAASGADLTDANTLFVGLLETAAASDSKPWVLLAPYAWSPAMKGDVGLFGTVTSIDLTQEDLINALPDVQGAAMLHFEMGQGRVGLIFDGLYMEVEPSGSLPVAAVTLNSKVSLVELLGMVRVIDEKEADGSMLWTVDLLAGTRYYDFSNSLTINPTIPLPTLVLAENANWFDLVVGARTAVNLTGGLDAFFRGDVGGFGIGNSSDLAWNIIAGVEYACPNVQGLSLILGYRVLSVDSVQDNGAFSWDVTMHGPVAAFALRF